MAKLLYKKLFFDTPYSTPRRKPVSIGDSGFDTRVESLMSKSSQAQLRTTSNWGVGWQTPLLMIILYISAFIIACGHLAIFIHLDRKQVDELEKIAPQSYIATASIILSNAFGISLKASLAISFTQCLWHTLRRSPLKVSTIESLFKLRSNPLLLFDHLVVASGPALFLITIMIWAVQIATSFPPGALTITASNQTWSEIMDVPTFNASFFGNGSGYDADRYSFTGFTNTDVVHNTFELAPGSQVPGYYNGYNLIFPSNGSTPTNLHFATDFSFSDLPLYTQTLATRILIDGKFDSLPSPCGVNCSFTQLLDLPYLECDTTTYNYTFWGGNISTPTPVFEATWTEHILNITTYETGLMFFNHAGQVIEVNLTLPGLGVGGNYSILPVANTTNTICSPSRANYTFHFLYENNVQLLNIVKGSITSLNVTSPVPPTGPVLYDNLGMAWDSVDFPGFLANVNFTTAAPVFGLEALNWTEPLVSWYRDLQLMNFIDGMANALSGTITDIGSASPYVVSGTIVPHTRFSAGFGNFELNNPITVATMDIWWQAGAPISLLNKYVVNQDMLNSALLNITLSAIPTMGWWTAKDTLVTKREAINIYTFSRPLNLIIPYFLSLLLALPLLAIGGLALRHNGVSAIDGGFTQLITTSTGSATLQRLAAGCCLGGEKDVTEALKELKIRFGELVGEEKRGVVKRAGFGTEEETVPLVKGKMYGIENHL